MKKKLKIFFLLTMLILFGRNSYSQDTLQSSGKNYSESPVWIQMMDDPNTNYYEAIKAYNAYWLNRTKPVLEEEDEMDGKTDYREMKREIKNEEKKDKTVVLTNEQWKKKNDDELMKYNIKRFERWVRDVKPFVQEDGRILTDEERMNILKKQQEEINNQKK